MGFFGTTITPQRSPYLSEGRLADIIGAIPVLSASDKYASRQLSEWRKKLGEACARGGWEQVFTEHPEFFRLHEDGGKHWVAMRWRWALDKDYDPQFGRVLTSDELSAATVDQIARLTRAPLTPQQIEMLMSTAVKLHASAIEHERNARWWIPIVLPAATTIIGILLGAWLKS